MKSVEGILRAKEVQEAKNGFKSVQLVIQEEGAKFTSLRIKPEEASQLELDKFVRVECGFNRWDDKAKRFTAEGINCYGVRVIVPEKKKPL